MKGLVNIVTGAGVVEEEEKEKTCKGQQRRVLVAASPSGLVVPSVVEIVTAIIK